ncbi:MAG: hypothetical protein HY775_06520 [Acidobacteria bacterium]|nr:hypothetical protein [Acidobacteriota bacterium]
MARRKTTVSIDEDLLRATKITAAREGKPDYVIFEEALRQRLGFDLLDRIRAGFVDMNLSEEDTTGISVRETKAARKKVASRRRRGRR